MNFKPLVAIVTLQGSGRAHFSVKILENRSEHVTTAQKATHNSTKRNSTKHTSRLRWVRSSLGFRYSDGFRCSVLALDSVVPLIPFFRWVASFIWFPVVPLLRWDPLGFAVLLVPLVRRFPLFRWVPMVPLVFVVLLGSFVYIVLVV